MHTQKSKTLFWRVFRGTHKLTLRLKGNRSLKFMPLSRNTKVSISSPWKDPSFVGHYLPGTAKVSDKGFNAKWEIQHFSLLFAQHWKSRDNYDKIVTSAFGIEFFMPVNIYQKNERAVKYGLLFIGLTFLAFFLFEILLDLRIHLFHYLMVGAALIMFFLLFLSLSEHIGFLASYIVAALSVLGINVWYCKHILKNKKRGYLIGGLSIVLYGFFFILLENETYSLVLGSLGLFIILALVMYLTRNIDWYGIGKDK